MRRFLGIGCSVVAAIVLSGCRPVVPSRVPPLPAAPAAPPLEGETARVPRELYPVDPSTVPSPAAAVPTVPSVYQPLSLAAYQQAKAAGRPVLLYFYANWCPRCAPQEPVNVELLQSAEVSPWGIAGFRINYNDSDTDADERALAREFGVNYQHTFVTLNRAGQVVWKATGTLNRDALKARLEGIR